MRKNIRAIGDEATREAPLAFARGVARARGLRTLGGDDVRGGRKRGRGWPPGGRGWRGARRRRRGKDGGGYEILRGNLSASFVSVSSLFDLLNLLSVDDALDEHFARRARDAVRDEGDAQHVAVARGRRKRVRERSVDGHARPRGKRKPRGERRRARVAPRHAHATRPVGTNTIHANPRAPVAVSRRE